MKTIADPGSDQGVITAEARRDASRDEQFFGGRLPLELGAHRAVRIYLRRLATLFVAAMAVLVLVSLVAFVGPIGALSVVLGITILGAMVSLRQSNRQAQDRSYGFHRILVTVVLILLPAGAAGAAAIAATSSSHLRFQLILLAATASLGVALLGQYLSLRAEVATRVSVQQSLRGVALTRTAQPLITALGEVAAAKDEQARRQAAETLVNKAVGIAQTVCGRSTESRPRTRSMFYELRSDERLERRAHEGQYDKLPRPDFDAQRSENDRRVVELAKGETVLLVNDLDSAPPDHFADYKGRPYKCYIAVPVRAGGRSFGILMIDSDVPNSLTDVDVGYAILLAGLVGAGLAMADTSSSPQAATRPDVGFIDEISETLDSVFVKELAQTVMSFSLIPSEDREFLADTINLQTYSKMIRELAEKRAKRGVQNIDMLALAWLRRARTAPTR